MSSGWGDEGEVFPVFTDQLGQDVGEGFERGRAAGGFHQLRDGADFFAAFFA